MNHVHIYAMSSTRLQHGCVYISLMRYTIQPNTRTYGVKAGQNRATRIEVSDARMLKQQVGRRMKDNKSSVAHEQNLQTQTLLEQHSRNHTKKPKAINKRVKYLRTLYCYTN